MEADIDYKEISTQILNNMRRQQLIMMRSFANPPYKILQVMEVVAYMLQQPPANINWNGFRRLIGNVSFIERLINFDPYKISAQTRAKIINFMEAHHMNTPEYKNSVICVCKAADLLFKWATAMLS